MKKHFLIVFLSIAGTIFWSSCTKPPDACFTFSPENNLANSEIIFNAGCSENVSTFIWEFDDGSADTSVTDAIISHTFISPGIYIVTLTVNRKDGVTFSEGEPITSKVVIVN